MQVARHVDDHDRRAVDAGRILGSDAQPVVSPVSVSGRFREGLELIVERTAGDSVRRRLRTAKWQRSKFDRGRSKA